MDRIPEFLSHFSGAGLPVEVFPYTLEEVAKMGEGGFMKTIEKEKIILGKKEKPETALPF